MATPFIYAYGAAKSGEPSFVQIIIARPLSSTEPCGIKQDKSFTCTLFAPTADFTRITSPAEFVGWMEEHFPDVIPLIGEQELVDMWVNNPRGSLITVKVRTSFPL